MEEFERIVSGAETALSKLLKAKVTVSVYLSPPSSSIVSLREILLLQVSSEFGFSPEALRSPSRNEDLVIARAVYSILARRIFRDTLVKIGDHLNRNHAAIHQQIEKLESLLHVDETLKKRVDSLHKQFLDYSLKHHNSK